MINTIASEASELNKEDSIRATLGTIKKETGKFASLSREDKRAYFNNIIATFGVKNGCSFTSAVEKRKKELQIELERLEKAEAGNFEAQRKLFQAKQDLEKISSFLLKSAQNTELYERGQENDENATTFKNTWNRLPPSICSPKKSKIDRPLGEKTSNSEIKQIDVKDPINFNETNFWEELYKQNNASPSKFLKCYTLFNSKTPTPFVNAVVSYPVQFASFTQSKLIETMDINQDIIYQNLDEPPYNKIRNFTFDIASNNVELEIFDTNDALGEMLIQQLVSLERYNGMLTIYVRYGWSAPQMTRQVAKLIEDMDDFKPAKSRRLRGPFSGNGLDIKTSSRARMYNSISFIPSNVEISKEGNGTSYKFSGQMNNMNFPSNPFMRKWMPLNKPELGPLPLINLGIGTQMEKIIGDIKRNLMDYGQFEKGSFSLDPTKIIPRPKKKLSKEVLREYDNLIEERVKLVKTKSDSIKDFIDVMNILLIAMSNQNYKKNLNKKYETKILSKIDVKPEDYYVKILEDKERANLNLNLALIDELKSGNTQKEIEKKQKAFYTLMSLAKNVKINIREAYDYVLNAMVEHLAIINGVAELQSNRMSIAIMNFVNFDNIYSDEGVAKQEESKNKLIAAELSGIPMDSITCTKETTYMDLLKSLVSKTKVKSKTTSGKDTFLDVNIEIVHAKSKVEIKEAVARISEELVDIRRVLKEETKNKKQSEYFERMVKIFESQINIIMREKLFKIDNASFINSMESFIKPEYDQLVIFMLSEFDLKGFIETTETLRGKVSLLQGYCFKPQGFKTQLNDYNITSGGQISKSSTTFFSGVNSNIFLDGSRSVYDVNFPDVISFTPEIKYDIIRAAIKKIEENDPFENFNIVANTKLERGEIDDTIKEAEGIVKEKKLRTEAQNKAEAEKNLEKSQAEMSMIAKQKLDFIYGDTDYELFPASVQTIPFSDNPRTMLNVKFHRTIFKDRLANLVTGYEATLVIVGEPYFDIHSLHKSIYVKVLTAEGNDTFYTGIYMIENIIHEKQGGSYKTTLKLRRTQAAENPIINRIIGMMTDRDLLVKK